MDKYKSVIKKGREDRIKEFLENCEPGWRKITEEFLENLVKEGVDLDIYSLRDLNGCMIYVNTKVKLSERVNKLISEFEELSECTCCKCGSNNAYQRKLHKRQHITVCEECDPIIGENILTKIKIFFS